MITWRLTRCNPWETLFGVALWCRSRLRCISAVRLHRILILVSAPRPLSSSPAAAARVRFLVPVYFGRHRFFTGSIPFFMFSPFGANRWSSWLLFLLFSFLARREPLPACGPPPPSPCRFLCAPMAHSTPWRRLRRRSSFTPPRKRGQRTREARSLSVCPCPCLCPPTRRLASSLLVCILCKVSVCGFCLRCHRASVSPWRGAAAVPLLNT